MVTIACMIPWLEKDSKKWVVWVVLAGLVAVTSWSLLIPGFFEIHDPLHAARMGEMLVALQDMHIPPRWSQNFGYGYGIPLFEFYAPLPYFIGALLLSVGLSLSLSFKLLFFIPSLIAILGAYLLGKRLYSSPMGLVMATLFGLAPYRAVNLFVRGAVSESWAMMTFPWIIWSGWKVLQGEKYGRRMLIGSTLVLLLSHNITSLLFLPLGTVFLLLLWGGKLYNSQIEMRFILRRLSSFVVCMALAMGTASFYVIPALIEKNAVAISVTTDQYYNVANHFLYLRQFITPFWGYGTSVYGPGDGLSFFLGWGLLAGLAVAGVSLLVVLVRHRFPVRSTLKGWWAVICFAFLIFSVLMTLEKTAFIWSHVSLLSFTQFPWRFLSVVSLFAALAVISGLALIKDKRLYYALGLLICGLTVWGSVLYFRPQQTLPDDQSVYFTDPTKIRQNLGDSLLEYLPTALPPHSSPVFSLVDLADSQYKIIENKVQQRTVQVSLDQDQIVTWQTAAFPGWQTRLDGKFIEYQVNSQGLITVSVPAGIHELQLIWGYTRVRLLSDTISLLSLGLAIFWLSSHRSRAEKTYHGKN